MKKPKRRNALPRAEITQAQRTKHARAEAALRQSEAQYRLFASAVSDILYRMSADWSEMHFLEGKSFLADTDNPNLTWLEKYIPDADKLLVQPTIADAIRTRTPFELEHRVFRADGTIGWTFSRAIPFLDERGDIVEWFGAASDITERKEAEEALRASEQRLQTMVNVPRVGVLTFDFAGQVLHANDAFLEMVGYLRTDFTAKVHTWLDFTPPEHVEASESVLKQIRQTGRGGPYEKEYFRKDGSRVWLMFVAADLGDGTIVEYAVDVSDRKRAEEALRESEARLQAMATNLPGGAAFIVDRDLRYLLAEGEALVNAGFAPSDLVGKTIFETLAPELAATYAPRFRQALAGIPFTHEHGAHGTVLLSRGTPLRSESGEIYAVLVVSYDISERKRAEEALRESETKYRTLFDSMDEGFCIFELLWDDEGNAVDWIYTEANPAFEQQTGYLNPIGKRIREFQPDLEHSWFERFAAVARTGEPMRFGEYTKAMGIWYDVYALRAGAAGESRVSLLFTDITESKRREADLAFLSEVDQDLARLTNIDETMNALGAKIGAHLGLSACIFGELFGENEAQIAELTHGWNRADVVSVVGTYRMSDFMSLELVQMWRTSEAVVIRDVFADPRTDGELYATFNVGSFLGIPLLRNDDWRFLLCVYHSEPHDWSEDEIALVRELMTRIWTRLERARAEEALRDADERFRTMADTANVLIWETDPSGIMFTNQHYLDFFGVEFEAVRGMEWTAFLHPDEAAGYISAYEKALAQRQPFLYECHFRRADGEYRWLFTTGQPVNAEHFIGSSTDITARKQAEDILARSNELLEERVKERTAQLKERTEELEARSSQVQDLLRQVVSIQEAERARVSRELHDQFGQRLTGFLLGINALKVGLPDGSEAATLAGRLQAEAAGLSHEMHQMAWNLRPPALDDMGLAAALSTFVREWSERHGIVGDFDGGNVEENRLPPEVETALYRIVQEALTNVVRHGEGASRVSVLLEQRDKQARLTVEDDGPGFDVEAAARSGRLGLKGMQERAALLGGTLELESVPGNGATLFVRIPLN